VRILLPLAVALTAAWSQPSGPDVAARRVKAREILDRAAQMAGAAPPVVHVMAMMDIGAVYRVFDKEKSVSLLRHAFAATSAVPEDDGTNFRTRFQTEIVKRLAAISPAEAGDMLRAMAEPGKDTGAGSATLKVVDVLMGREQPEFDRAIEMVNLVPETGEYAYDAAERIFLKLPKGDLRRTLVFGNALAAYQRRSTGIAFPGMLSRCWRQLPRDTAQSAVAGVVNAIVGRAEEPGNTEAGFSANEEGVRRANSRKAKELLDLIHVVRELDPKRAKELLAKYPEIANSPAPKEPAEQKAAAAGSDDDPTDFAMPLVPFRPTMNAEAMTAELDKYLQAMKKVEEARAAMPEDPKKAMELAAEVEPRLRASLLATLAEMASGKDPALGRSLVDKCAGLLSDLKDPGDRVLPWAGIAEAAHKLNKDELAAEALRHALDDVVEVYTRDMDPDMPNTALPDQWPSVVGCRLVTWSAVKVLGAEAEALLSGIRNQDLVLLAHVEMGRALLDERRREWSIQWNYSK
jgi:hypothetical protein